MTEREVRAHRVLALAEQLGNVAEACRRCGVTRTQFYRYRKLAEEHAQEARPIALSAAGRMSKRMHLVRELALQHPAAGIQTLADRVHADTGQPVSNRTIQHDLGKVGLGLHRQRWLALEALFQAGEALSDEQCAFVEAFNPFFRERGTSTPMPGERLYQGVFFAGKYGNGKLPLYIHYVLDASSLYLFGMAHHNKRPDASVVLLRQQVIPHFKKLQMPIVQIRTDRSSTFNGRASHLYRLFLMLFRIEHVMQPPAMNAGYRSTVFDVFKAGPLQRLHQQRRVTLQQIATAVQAVVALHNERRRPGYPHWGDSPSMRIQAQTNQTAT